MGGKLCYLTFVSIACILAQHFPVSHAFYIPGVAPTEYSDGQKLDIKVKACAVYTSLTVLIEWKCYNLRVIINMGSLCLFELGRSACLWILSQLVRTNSNGVAHGLWFFNGMINKLLWWATQCKLGMHVHTLFVHAKFIPINTHLPVLCHIWLQSSYIGRQDDQCEDSVTVRVLHAAFLSAQGWRHTVQVTQLG